MMLKGIVVIVSLMLLSACGGGGGGGGGTSSSISNKLTVNAGADLTVNMLARVDLDPKVLVSNVTSATLNSQGLELLGSSENKESIVLLTWTKIEGPDFSISSSGFNDGVIYFIAPNTGGASSVKISFKLKITNAAGVSAEDTITITVNRVNQAPIANAGDDKVVDSGESVVLDAALSNDADGRIAKYQWTQLAGSPVVLVDAATAKASFISPSITEEELLEFELSVEDNEGRAASDKVSVKIVPGNAPKVQLYFPPAKGIYTNNTISLFGMVKAVNPSSIATMTVDAGNGPIVIAVEPDGSWRFEDLILPTGTSDVSIVVEATDTEGRKSIARSQLKTSPKTPAGTGQSWNEIVGIDIDSAANKLWMITYNNINMKLLSIDLNNGNRSNTISDFGDTAQGVSTSSPTHMAFDTATKSVYLAASAPTGSSNSGQILRIDTLTGKRSLVSDNTRGTGPDLELPWGLVAGDGGKLYVADNRSDSIVSIDPNTGNRTVIADTNTLNYGIDAPLLLARDERDASSRLYMAPYADYAYVFELDLSGQKVTNSLVVDGFGSNDLLMGDITGLAFDSLNNTVFFTTFFKGLVGVNLLTGEVRTNIADLSMDTLAFDEEKGVLYLLDDFPAVLYAVDPLSGQSVIISKPNSF